MDDGSAVYFSGRGDNNREYAGTAIFAAPHMRKHILGFNPISSRICSLKLRVAGGCSYIFSVYAPHNLYPLPERRAFYDELEVALERTSANGPRFIFGDLNARIGQRRPNEGAVLGAHCFGREAVHKVEVPNRDLLYEFCLGLGLIIANTFLPGDDHARVTYFEVGARPLDAISPSTFAMLDLLLLPTRCAHRLISGQSDRYACLASHHLPFTRSRCQVDLGQGEDQESADRLERLEHPKCPPTLLNRVLASGFGNYRQMSCRALVPPLQTGLGISGPGFAIVTLEEV